MDVLRKVGVLGAALAVLLLAGVASAKDTPSGTVTLSTGSFAAGVGYSWGGGTLKYKGKTHHFEISGLSVGSVGIKKATASGKVYHLNKLEDFDGNYTSVAAGATVGGGGGVSSMQNQNGVVINLVSTTKGVSFTLAAAGVSIKLK
ncbi:MAG TPA: DUF1134 domain-containing protein [Candidatus Bathyarchaeia archaeon]|nr:DUF1134 domain-containing protein [Candidatus Bathyarchaeia archaeon]